MGVKYLSTFLRCHADKIGQLTELPPLSDAESEATQRRNIIVDSHGFLMAFASEVISRCESELGEESFRYAALAGGDLQYIRSAMTFMITRLRHVYGVELVFAVDAPSGIVQNDATNRGAVVAKRGVERETLLAKQLEVCATTNMSLAADKLLKQNNRPQMLVEQLYETLFQLNVIVKHLDDEVDRYIGALVHDFNPICVFTGDSDFVVTPGIPVVMDFDYPWDVMLHGWDASVRYSTMANDALRSFIVDVSRSSPGISVVNDEPLCLLIVESAGLASFLDLDDENVLLLAMSLCGNDITEVVVKEIGPPQIADRDFQTAAVLAKEIANYPTRIDKTKGLFSQIRRGNSRKEILRVLGLVKNLLERVRVEGPEELRAWFYSSPYEWGQVQKIFEPKWFVNWIFSVPVNDSVCVAVVHALDALASMSTDFIAILNYMECDDDTLSNATGHNSSGTKSSNSSSGTEHNSNRSSDSTDSFVDEDPFLKSLEPFVPFEILLSIQQYKLSSQRVAYEPIQFKERPEERVLYDNFTSQRLPLSLLLIARSGQCHDHPIPVISGRFGFSLDLFTFYRLRQVIARHLGRVTIRVRNHSGDVVKPCEPKLSDDWPTAATAPVVPTDDDGSEQQQQQADIRTHREVPVSLPENVMDAAKTGDPAIYEIFDANKDVLQSTLSNNEGVNGDGPPSATLLVMWVVHAGCTSFDEVRRLAEMMVLLHYSERGDEEMASAARSAVKGVARFNHERSLERGSCARGRRLRGSPTHRTIELSRLFAAAFAEVLHLVKLLGIDNVWHLPEPADVFSGTLLHDLMTLESPLCLETLVRSATLSEVVAPQSSAPPKLFNEPMGRVMLTITALCTQFEKGFKTLQYRQADHYVALKAAPVLRVDTPDEEMDSLESAGATRTPLPGAARGTSVRPAPHVESPQVLPIEKHVPELLRQVAGNRVVLVKGETGCGKSSMVPLCLHRDAVAQGRYSYIICTQPRRFAASELAERVAHLLGEEVGQTVGYRIGGDTQENYEKTRILFVTTGYLLENLSHRRQGGLWSRATHIVLDEVHERSLESDAMMLVIRLLLQQEDDEGVAHHRAKRLILMSATISMTLFQNYFSSLNYPMKSGRERLAAQRAATSRAGSILARPLSPTVLAGERPKTVSVDFLSDIIADVQQRIPGFPSDALNTLKSYAVRADRAKPFAALQLSPKEVESMCQLILSYAKPRGCILVFLPGLKEIEDFFQAITDLGQISDSLSPRLFQLHSIIPHIDQKRIFVPADSNECKIILSTNIAETSVTIKDVTVVVDLGFVRRVVYDKKKNAKIIRTQWCSRAASTQRMGRAGRVTDGRNLRFYTEHVYKNLMTEFDESVLFPLEAPILKFRLHFAHLGAVEELFAQLIESPAKENVSQALSRLVRFGALGPAPEYEVLNFGRIAADLPVDIKFSRAIVLASRYGLAGEIAVIAAGHVLTYSLYQLPRRTACKSDAHFQAWMLETFESMHHFDGGRCSDPLQFLSIMEEVLAIRGEQKRRTFCFRNKLDYQQVAWLIKTTTSICNRIRESTALASLTFTAEDADLMDALRNPATHQGVKFASLRPESCTVEYLEVVLTACADSMLGGVLAAPSMDEDLADPKHFSSKKDHKTALSWVRSQQKDVILFSGITESVYDAGEAVFKECLRCFGASSVVFLEQSHGGMAAAVQIPKILDENFAVRSALKTSPRVNAICRMNMLHTTKKWSFSSANGNHLVILPHPETSNTVVEWRSFNLAAERQLWEQSSEDEFCSEEEYSHDDDYNCEEESEQYDESDEDEQYQDEGGSGEDVFHWRHRLLVDKWSSVGSYFIGDQSSNPALLGVAFSLTYMGHTPIATCNFLLPTQESQNVLSFLAALVHLPPTLTVTLGKRRNTSDVTIKELFTADKQVNDVLRLLRPPISPILLLELNLHRLSLHMLTDAFTRSDYQCLCEVRVLLRSLRKKADKTFVPLTRDGHLEQVVELTSHIAEASPHVESGHDLLIFVDIDPLEEVAEIARCPHWRSAVTEYRHCMKMLEAGERVRVSMQSDEPNKHSSATKERGTTWAGSLSPTAIDVRAAVVVPPAATTKPLPNERPTTRKNVVPREFRLDDQVVPIDRLLRNQFVTDCIQSGTNVGRLCTNHRQHSRMTCRFAHFDRYAMKQGSDVSGSDVLDNVALKVLRNNSNFTGSFCTKGHCPNPMQCTYLHRK